MTNDLIAVINQAIYEIDLLESLKNELVYLETPNLVSGYMMVKDYSKKVEGFSQAVRRELLFGSGVGAQGYNGRFFSDVLEVDKRGHRYLYGAHGECLKAQKRLTYKLNEQRATQLLRDKGLYKHVLDKCEVKVDKTVIDELNQLKDLLDRVTNEFAPDSVPEGLKKALEKVNDIISMMDYEEKINKDHINHLEKLGFISAKEKDEMLDVKVSYALLTNANRTK